MDALDIFLIFSVTIGPLESGGVFVAMTTEADPQLRRRIAVRTVAMAAAVCGVFALLGRQILTIFHVSVPAMLIAGGIILFSFALNLVLGKNGAEPAGAGAQPPSLDIAAYPLAMPLMASPQGLVAILAIGAAPSGAAPLGRVFAMVMAMMAINLVFLLFAHRIFNLLSPDKMGVAMRVSSLLLCGMAVELVLFGLQDLGVLGARALP